MLVNGYLDFPGIYSTVCNDYQAMYDAVSRLIASGKRNILYLYTSHSYSGLNKVQGYKNALADRGAPGPERTDPSVRQGSDSLQTADRTAGGFRPFL